MSQVKLYSVYDNKACIYQPINQYRTDDEAVRAFGVSCNDPNSNFFKFAEDFSMFYLGILDEDTGVIECHVPILVSTATAISRAHNEYYAARLMDKSVA